MSAVIIVLFYAFFWSAPSAFPIASTYEVNSGDVYTKTAYDLRDMGVIRSPFWFKTFVYVFALGER